MEKVDLHKSRKISDEKFERLKAALLEVAAKGPRDLMSPEEYAQYMEQKRRVAIAAQEAGAMVIV